MSFALSKESSVNRTSRVVFMSVSTKCHPFYLVSLSLFIYFSMISYSSVIVDFDTGAMSSTLVHRSGHKLMPLFISSALWILNPAWSVTIYNFTVFSLWYIRILSRFILRIVTPLNMDGISEIIARDLDLNLPITRSSWAKNRDVPMPNVSSTCMIIKTLQFSVNLLVSYALVDLRDLHPKWFDLMV